MDQQKHWNNIADSYDDEVFYRDISGSTATKITKLQTSAAEPGKGSPIYLLVLKMFLLLIFLKIALLLLKNVITAM